MGKDAVEAHARATLGDPSVRLRNGHYVRELCGVLKNPAGRSGADRLSG